MKLDRIDFGKSNRCKHCNRQLINKAYVVKNKDGEETFFGSECIKKYFPTIDKNIPNFIRADINNGVYDSNNIDFEVIENNNKNDGNIYEKYIIEYIRLRCELLDDFKGIKFDFMMDLYDKSKKSELSLEQKNKLYNIIIKLNKEKPKLGYNNLMACYMAKCILQLLIKKTNSDYVKARYDFLKINYYLSEKQIIGLNNRIKGENGIKNINGKWFYKK